MTLATRPARPPLLIAHRGHSAGAPEQTMRAFVEAVTHNADMIEADVRRTRDGRLVLLHDPTVDRTTDGTGAVADLDFAAVRELDAGTWYSDGFAGLRIPLLDELFDLAEAAGVGLCLEAKGETAADRAAMAVTIATRIRRRDRARLDVVAAFDHAALLAAARAVPGTRLAPERLPERGLSVPSALIRQARRIGATIVQHHHADVTAGVVGAAHAAGLAVWAWPPRTAEDIGRVLALGVDGVMGGDVAALRTASVIPSNAPVLPRSVRRRTR